jgi:uncharacterized protein (TIGR02996 family)
VVIDDCDAQGLLRAIKDDPDDDAPRLILADRYDELDYGASANFIRESVAAGQASRDCAQRFGVCVCETSDSCAACSHSTAFVKLWGDKQRCFHTGVWNGVFSPNDTVASEGSAQWLRDTIGWRFDVHGKTANREYCHMRAQEMAYTAGNAPYMRENLSNGVLCATEHDADNTVLHLRRGLPEYLEVSLSRLYMPPIKRALSLFPIRQVLIADARPVVVGRARRSRTNAVSAEGYAQSVMASMMGGRFVTREPRNYPPSQRPPDAVHIGVDGDVYVVPYGCTLHQPWHAIGETPQYRWYRDDYALLGSGMDVGVTARIKRDIFDGLQGGRKMDIQVGRHMIQVCDYGTPFVAYAALCDAVFSICQMPAGTS